MARKFAGENFNTLFSEKHSYLVGYEYSGPLNSMASSGDLE
jgi:hypothetical protein